jgi:hypothetical protein
MIKRLSRAELKKIPQKELEKMWAILHDCVDDVEFEYYRRQAMHVKKAEPQYYKDHFKKIYG